MNLKIKDIDPERMMIRVERGKGGKDRYTIPVQKPAHRTTPWKRHRPSIWLFSNRVKNGPLSRNEAWHIYNRAKKRVGLKKGRGIHTCGSVLDYLGRYTIAWRSLMIEFSQSVTDKSPSVTAIEKTTVSVNS